MHLADSLGMGKFMVRRSSSDHEWRCHDRFAGEQQLHHAHVVVIAFSCPDRQPTQVRRKRLYTIECGPESSEADAHRHRSTQIGLKHNSHVIQAKLRSEPFENIERRLRHVRPFHIDAHKVYRAGCIFQQYCAHFDKQDQGRFPTNCVSLIETFELIPVLID